MIYSSTNLYSQLLQSSAITSSIKKCKTHPNVNHLIYSLISFVVAQTIYSILNQLGVEEAEPKVLHQLMEFVFRTTSDYLELASIYAEHAGRDLEVSDVQLAIQNKSQIEFVGPPPREVSLVYFLTV